MRKNIFFQPDRKANRFRKIEKSDRLNAFWSGRIFCQLACFKTCCRTDIAVRFIDKYLVQKCQAQK